MLQIKTIRNRLDNPTLFDDEVNAALCDGWTLKKRTVIRPIGQSESVYMLLSQFYTLTDEEIMCIRYHMGAFTDKSEWNDYTRAVRQYPNVLWTHQADMLASHVAGV